MFAHIFVTRFKCIVRDRYTMFWTLLFPIILATLFHFAFANMGKSYTFSKFNIAVVNNSQFQKSAAFKNALDSVSGKSKKSGRTGTQALFNVKYCSKANADALLKDSKIEGYIDYDTSPKLVVKTSDFDQSILKAFIDEYKQTSDAAMTIIKKNPMAAATLMSNISENKIYLKAVSQSGSKSNSNVFVNYFYALIGMACLYGGFFGMKEVGAVQANQSAQGARVNMAPVNKLKVFFSAISAATAVQFICAFVLLAYLIFALKVDFGTKVPLILLACAVSSFTGVSYGAFLGSIIKGGEGLKISILISVSMIMSFLSGLMIDGMKYVMQKYAPVAAFLNPANAITDSFYSLYYYDTTTRFFTNIAILLGFSAVFYLGVYFVMRRQKYASI